MNIIEFMKEIESLFNKLKFRYDLRDGFKLQLEESVYEQNGIEFSLPTKVKLSVMSDRNRRVVIFREKR